MQSSFDLPDIPVFFIKELHAKCYLNEKEALVTSMNLHEFSQEHNHEMGILVSKQDDPELYEEIYQEANRLKDASGKSHTTSRSKSKVKVAEATSSTYNIAKKPKNGFCIRCKTVLAANPKKPYCVNCYESWSRYSNTAYREKHCHTCGRRLAATLLKPLCTSCYAKYGDVLEFVTR